MGREKKSVGDGGTGYKRLRGTAAELTQRVSGSTEIKMNVEGGGVSEVCFYLRQTRDVTAGLGCPRGDWVGLKESAESGSDPYAS